MSSRGFLGPLYNKCSPCKYPLFLGYCFGLGLSWSSATFCYKMIYLTTSTLLLIFSVDLYRYIKYNINIGLLCAMWAVELTIDKISDSDSTCLASETYFPRFSLWFFRFCLGMITLSSVMPFLIKCFCINSTAVRAIFPQEDEPEPVEMGINPKAFESLLPLRQYSKESLKGNQELKEQPESGQKEEVNEDVCPICLEEFNEGEDVRRINSCEHVFHPHCIEQWISNHLNCPYCRNDIIPRDQSIQQQNNSGVIYQPPLFESLALVNDMAGNIIVPRNGEEMNQMRRNDGQNPSQRNELHYDY